MSSNSILFYLNKKTTKNVYWIIIVQKASLSNERIVQLLYLKLIYHQDNICKTAHYETPKKVRSIVIIGHETFDLLKQIKYILIHILVSNLALFGFTVSTFSCPCYQPTQCQPFSCKYNM